jgi:FAD/FMN-containing dehydrogenase
VLSPQPNAFLILSLSLLFFNSSMGQTSSAPSAALRSCLTQAVNSNVAFPNPLWQLSDVKRYNLDIDSNPAAITYPSSNEQVAKVITCARDNKAKVQARSGGHSYGNFALGGADGGNTVVVDLGKFQQFSIDNQSWIATIGAGTLLGDVTDKLQEHGRAMAHGTCPQVGIGGHATIGTYLVCRT